MASFYASRPDAWNRRERWPTMEVDAASSPLHTRRRPFRDRRFNRAVLRDTLHNRVQTARGGKCVEANRSLPGAGPSPHDPFTLSAPTFVVSKGPE